MERFSNNRAAGCRTKRAVCLAAIVTLVCALGIFVLPGTAKAGTPGVELYIAKNGNDSWSGRLDAPSHSGNDGPFATLARARSEIRKIKAEKGLPLGGMVVELRTGTYYLESSFDLTGPDSGSADSPVVYHARKGERVTLSGGVPIPAWSAVTDGSALDRLPAEAKGHVLQANVRSRGLLDYGNPSGGGVELFFAGRPMVLARWPNAGFARIEGMVPEQPFDVRGEKGFRVGKFTYAGDRPRRWVGEKDLWAHGYWFWDWAEGRQKVAAIDTAHSVIELARPYHEYGYRAGQWYYIYNALSELDVPGEWYLDRDTGILYFWPPAALTGTAAVVSRLESLVRVTGVSHVSFESMTLEATRGTAVTVRDSDDVTLSRLLIRNTGGWGVQVAGGKRCQVVNSVVTRTGEGGISISGGVRSTLEPARHTVGNNTISSFSRWQTIGRPGVEVYGVGNRIAHNHIFDAPHQAIYFSGNNHVIEYNEIDHVCQETNDAGAIYAGRDWTMRGNLVRHNYLHDIKGRASAGAIGVYLDDMFSGTEVVENIFHSVATAILIGGGRDNLVSGNLFTNCNLGLHLDSRGLEWAAPAVTTVMMDRLREVPYRTELWRSRYPQLYGILDQHPGSAAGNQVSHNLSWKGTFVEVDAGTKARSSFTGNLVNVDPEFFDNERPFSGVRKTSPLYQSGLWPPEETIGTLIVK